MSERRRLHPHDCPIASCGDKKPRSRLMCRRHWYQVPPELRTAVLRSWRTLCGVDRGHRGENMVDAYKRWRDDAEAAIEAVEQRHREAA